MSDAADALGVGGPGRDVAVGEQDPGGRLDGLSDRLDEAGVGDDGRPSCRRSASMRVG